MRILHIFDDYGTPGERALAGEGSVPSVVYYIAKYAAEKGHDVTIIERDFGMLPEEEEIDGIRFIRIKAEKLPAAPSNLIKSPFGLSQLILDAFSLAVKINRFITENDFDVIHVHFPFAANVLIHLSRELSERMVYTAHMDEYRLGLSKIIKPPITARIFSPDLHLIKRVKKTIVLNESLKGKLVLKGVKDEKLEVIPNGVKVENPNFNDDEMGEIKEKYGIKEHAVLFVGTITLRKGIEYLVKTAKILKEEGHRIIFILAGNTSLDEEYAEGIQEYIEKHGLNVKLTGFIPHDDLMKLYHACDIFVLPSLEEGFGMVLTQAMACGRPLIGTNVGGIPMQIRDGWNGFLVEPANEEKQLAEKIKYLIYNEEERIRMGKNSKKLAEEKFDWEKIAEKYLEVYGVAVR